MTLKCKNEVTDKIPLMSKGSFSTLGFILDEAVLNSY